jgi:ABC-type Mn2+/Zn2+ transport system permease subunit/Mn-dependent DtxR family transcriptional regulator
MSLEILDVLQYNYAIRALLAASIVGITCGVLGCFVVLRRMALIGDALSHSVLPGVVLGFVFFGHNPLAIFTGAVLAGLVTAVFITWLQRNSITKDDASVGIVFTAMFAIGILGISWLTKRQGVHLDMKDFLFGNVLGVTDADLWLTSLIGVYVLVCVVLFFKYFFITTFDPLIALTMGISVAVLHYFLMFLLSITIVASIQSVGVILVVAMLIIPASTSYLLVKRLSWMVFYAGVIGLLSASLGFLLSVYTNSAPGPVMTLIATLFFVLALVFSPRRGLLFRYINKKRKQLFICQQDILKKMYIITEKENNTTTREKIALELGYNLGFVKLLIWLMSIQNLVNVVNKNISLTEKGKNEAKSLIRAHRMWESYLANKLNVPHDQLHKHAEEMEHHLPKHFVDKLEQDLGFPTKDPHGSPIPNLKKRQLKLSELKVGQSAIIDSVQQSATKELWRLGIFPNTFFVVKELDAKYVTIQAENTTFVIEKPISEKIKVII